MMVKVCGITCTDDALASVDAGASAIGFNFYPQSPRYVTVKTAAEIAAVLPSHVWKTGIFVNEPAGTIERVARQVGLDVVQLYGDCTVSGFRIWRARPVDAAFRAESIEDEAAEAVLLETVGGSLPGGTGRTFDWTLARGLRKKIILAGGLDGSNVREAIRTARPWGVDASSRMEYAPGRKDHERIRQFVKAALAETL